MSVQISYKKQFVIVSVFLLALLIPIEGFARTYEFFNPNCFLIEKDAFDNMPKYLVKRMCQDHNDLKLDSSGTITRIVPNQLTETYNINSFGFRGPETSKEKPDGVYRIFLVGGSTAFGTVSSSDDKTISGFLQQKFDKTDFGKKVEVINAATPGAISSKEKYYIENFLLGFEPDLFIVYDGANDARYRVLEPLQEKQSKTVDNGQEFKEENIESDKLYMSDLIKLYRTPYVINSLMTEKDEKPEDEFAPDRCFGEFNKCPPMSSEIASQVISLWKNRWMEVCESGKEEGYSTIIALQPMVGAGKKTLSPDEYRFTPNSLHGKGVISILNGMSSSLGELEKVCDKTVDLRSIFDDVTDPVYFDDLHVTDFGNEIIAEKLFDIALPLVN